MPLKQFVAWDIALATRNNLKPWRFEIKIAFIVTCIFLLVLPLIEILLQTSKLLSYLFLAIFSFLVVLIITSLILKSKLKETTNLIKLIDHGNHVYKIPTGSGDGFDDLFNRLDQLAEKLEKEKTDQQLNELRLDAIFAGMPEGVLVIDGENHIRLINQSLCAMFGINENILGKTPLEAIHIYDVKEIAQNILSQKSEKEEREISIVFPHEKILKVFASTVRPNGAILVFHDITQLKHLERVRRDFVANVSHELRTPVSTIKGYAETLLDGAIDDRANAIDFLEIIKSDANRLSLLINDLLDLSRLESGTLLVSHSPVDFGVLVEDVLKKLSKLAQEKNVNLRHIKSQKSIIVRADDKLMMQVLLNLIENAIKYNRPNGDVEIEVKVISDTVNIVVADTGIGIPHEEMSRIFERFYRVDQAHSSQLDGTGLGLSIVKHIIQAHHGDVTVHSELGRGSTFTVILPLR